MKRLSSVKRPLEAVRRAFLYSFLGVFTLGLGVQVSYVEAAKWTRSHASACIAVLPLSGAWKAPYDTSYALYNNNANSEMVLLCPLSDTDYLAKGSLNSLNIHGFDGSSTANVSAKACRSNWATVGGACSPQVSSAGVGNYALSPDRTVLKNVIADFGYVWIFLPPKVDSGRSGVRGIYTSD